VSCTGRGTTRDPKDRYPTPYPSFAPLLPILPRDVVYHDPCAGDGDLVRYLRESGREATGADLYPVADGGYDATPRDYLRDDTIRDFVLTNPPFSVAFEMCQHAERRSVEFMLLLRLSFLESKERAAWLSTHEPDALFVLAERPSFVMSVTCKTKVLATPSEYSAGKPMSVACAHNWLLPVESERPRSCPKCGGTKLAISTSDNAGYAWFYFGPRYTGIHHLLPVAAPKAELVLE
jgi:hypothetical protein